MHWAFRSAAVIRPSCAAMASSTAWRKLSSLPAPRYSYPSFVSGPPFDLAPADLALFSGAFSLVNFGAQGAIMPLLDATQPSLRATLAVVTGATGATLAVVGVSGVLVFAPSLGHFARTALVGLCFLP